MHITIFQFDTIWLDKEANLTKIKTAFQSLPNCDLFLLPEMFNTGYTMDPSLGAESLDGHTIEALVSMVGETNTIIGGSIPTKIDGLYYNSFVLVGKNGLIGQYSKQHLFALAGEAKLYSSGKAEVTIQIHEALVKPLICYDLRFPYASYNKDNKPYDLLIYSANWPVGRILQWEKLLMARAIENQCYVIGINRVGEDANGYNYPGRSMVVNYTGEVMKCLDDTEQMASIVLDFNSMYAYRNQFPFLQDRKVF